MDYLCAEFGDFSFNLFDFIMPYKQTESHTQTRMTAILTRLPVGVNT